MAFLAELQSRPLNVGDSKGSIPKALFLGQGSNALEVAVLEAVSPPSIGTLRAIWNSRLAGRATPLLVVVLNGGSASLCGPTGDPPPAFQNLRSDLVERICRTALAKPDRNSALRFLATVISEADSPLPGVRNEGLFATHELRYGLPQRKQWTEKRTHAEPLIALRGEKLLESLGYAIEAATGPVSILRSEEGRRAVAVFLDQNESPDLPSARFAQLSPVSYALAKADQENLDWVVVSAGSALRLHPVGNGIGTGRRSRTDTFAELQLDLLAREDAGYLWFIFSADALRKNGSVSELLANSEQYAADLGARLRERIYSEVIPALAMAMLEARDLQKPTSHDLSETYQMTLVYLFRLLFLAYAEDKDLLPFKHNQLYRDRSLKHKAQELAQLKRNATSFGPDSSLWEEIDRLFKAVDKGNASWGVPAYNGGLFSRDLAVSALGAKLAGIQLPDVVLGPVLTSLLVDQSDEGWGPVDFRSLGVREFGTIYEGLLENELAIAETSLAVKGKDKQYAPATGKDKVIVAKGNAYLHNTSGSRKSTGSYFTKHFAVEHLLDHALKPALEEHCARLDSLPESDVAKSFFDFRVADLAMGSGHFLVAVVDRIERVLSNYLASRKLPTVHEELSRLREAAKEALGPLAANIVIEDTQLLRRQIARRCIYGVDLNPIAVDLARLAIWIHTFVPGLPLSFLDHSLVTGNALVGIGTLAEANECLEQMGGSLMRISEEELRPALEPLRRLASLSDASAAEISKARAAFLEAKRAAAPVAALFDILAAARIDEECRSAVFQDGARWIAKLSKLPGSAIHEKARAVLNDLPPFHFPVAFPEVFLRERSGFDVLLGNPPWEEATVEEDRFWTRHNPGFHSLTQQAQESLKKKLRATRADLFHQHERERVQAELLRTVLTSGQYPGMGTGDPDVYKAFYWKFWELLAKGSGWAGIVLPRNAMSAKGSSEFRKAAFSDGQFFDLTWLLNNQGWVFDDVHPQYTIVLAVFTKRPATADQMLPMRGPFRSLERFEAGVKRKSLSFSVKEIGTWTDTWALPLLPNDDAGEAFAQLRKSPRLDFPVAGGWRVRPVAELHATSDKPLMKLTDEQPEGYWPVFKGESFDIWQPDTGRYYAWAKPSKITAALQEKRVRSARLERSAFSGFPSAWVNDIDTLPCWKPRIAFRDVSRATDTRTIRAALLPGEVVLTNKAPYLVWPIGDTKDQAYLLGLLCSIPLDWYARRFVEINLNFFILNPFPIPRPSRSSELWQRVVGLSGRLAAPDARFADWAKQVGVKHGKLHPDEKAAHIYELDAVVAHLYGLSARQLRVIYETFHEGWDFEDQLRDTMKYFDQWKGRA